MTSVEKLAQNRDGWKNLVVTAMDQNGLSKPVKKKVSLQLKSHRHTQTFVFLYVKPMKDHELVRKIFPLELIPTTI